MRLHAQKASTKMPLRTQLTAQYAYLGWCYVLLQCWFAGGIHKDVTAAPHLATPRADALVAAPAPFHISVGKAGPRLAQFWISFAEILREGRTSRTVRRFGASAF